MYYSYALTLHCSYSAKCWQGKTSVESLHLEQKFLVNSANFFPPNISHYTIAKQYSL